MALELLLNMSVSEKCEGAATEELILLEEAGETLGAGWTTFEINFTFELHKFGDKFSQVGYVVREITHNGAQLIVREINAVSFSASCSERLNSD